MRISLKVQLLLAWSHVQPSMTQCHTTPRVTTKPSDKSVYQTDEIDLKEILISLLDYVQIIKDEYWGNFGSNLTLTYPGDGSCSILGIGFPLSDVASSVVWGNPVTQIPILVNVLKISEKRIYIPSENTSVLLTMDQFKEVCKELGIMLKIKENGVPQMTIYKETSGELILQNFNVEELNVCRMSILGINLKHDLENTLQLLQDQWETLSKMITFYGLNSLLQELGTCISSKNMTIEFFLNTKKSSFLFCINSLANEPKMQEKEKRSANLLSFLLGDGKQMNQIENTLKASIDHYNANFKKLKVFDDQIIDTFQNMDKEITNLENLEIHLQDKIAEINRFTKLQDIKLQYLLVKLQHSSALHRLLTESKLLQNLRLLERALFSANECTISTCELNISAELLGSKVLVHREILELKPVMKFLVSCRAVSISTVPQLHNQLAERTQSGDFLIGTQIYTPELLSNASVVNEQARLLTISEKLLGSFHHFQSSGINKIQCLEHLQFTLNGRELDCTELQTFELPEEFILQANGEELRSQKLVEARQRVAVGWLRDYEFSNIDTLQEDKEPRLTILHPSLERFFYDEAGQLKVENASLLGTGMVIFLITIIAICCWKVKCFRECAFSQIQKAYSTLYKLCTTEQYRLKQKRHQLDKKIDKGYDELKKMEGLIEKKKEINKKLPRAKSVEPTAPPAEVIEKIPGKPRVPQTKTMVEVHTPRYVEHRHMSCSKIPQE